MSRTLKLLWCAIVPLALLVACAGLPEKHVRIVIVPEQNAESEARQKKVSLTDLVFKQNAANRIDEHPFFFSKDKLEPHGNGCESKLTISISKHEEVVWEADSKFSIIGIEQSAPCPGDTKDPERRALNPFFGTMPYTSTVAAPFVVHSGPARVESAGQTYKITIQINGQTLDPDIFCMM